MSLIRPLTVALLGVLLCLAGATFDSESLYVPGVALVGIAVLATGWVLLAANGATLVRQPGPHTVVEEQPRDDEGQRELQSRSRAGHLDRPRAPERAR